MTKDEIINCTDGQALADAVAVEVMGWRLDTEYDDWLFHGSAMIGREFWQPHKPTEKGKAQCWDLVITLQLCLVRNEGGVYFAIKDMVTDETILSGIEEQDPQIAVLKAALLTVKE